MDRLDAVTQLENHSRAIKGMRRGVWLMLSGFPLVPPIGILTAFDDDFAFLFFVPVLLFIAGFARLLYGTFVQGRASRLKNKSSAAIDASNTAAQLGPTARHPELLTARVAPIGGATGNRVATSEMVQPSVTENTTRLLEDEIR